MGIPPLDNRGLLPEGVHCASLQDIEEWARTVPDVSRRLKLLNNLKRFIDTEISNKYHLSNFPIVLGGSFFTDKTRPGDIDLAIEIPEAQITNDEVCKNAFKFQNQHSSFKNNYELDTYIFVKNGVYDFEDFFGYVGQKSGLVKGLPPKARKGTVRIEP